MVGNPLRATRLGYHRTGCKLNRTLQCYSCDPAKIGISPHSGVRGHATLHICRRSGVSRKLKTLGVLPGLFLKLKANAGLPEVVDHMTSNTAPVVRPVEGHGLNS
jgi:hypothetical protein